MTLDVFDVLWNIPMLFFSFVLCWKLLRTPKGQHTWHLWPWYAAVSVCWTVNTVLEYTQGDTLWMWISAILAALNGFVAVIHFYEHSWEKEIQAQEQAYRDGFEKFRIK